MLRMARAKGLKVPWGQGVVGSKGRGIKRRARAQRRAIVVGSALGLLPTPLVASLRSGVNRWGTGVFAPQPRISIPQPCQSHSPADPKALPIPRLSPCVT